MPNIGEAELKAQLKNSDFSNAYMIYGEEGYLKEFYVNKLTEKLVDSAFADFNLHRHETNNSSLDDILMDCSMLPMMSEHSLTVAHDFPFDGKKDSEKLEEFFKDMPEGSVLVFWFDSLEVNPKESKWSKLIKLFSKYGSAVNLQKRSEAELVKLVIKSAKKRDCVIDGVNARYLINAVGADIQNLFSELEKICSCVNGAEITKKDIDELAVKSLQARVYDLSKNILKGNSNGAYSVLNALFYQKEEPIPILAVLSSCYIDMYRAKCAKQADVALSNVVKEFNYGNRDFAVKNAARDSANMSLETLRACLDVLSDADEKMKSTAINPNIVLEETVAKLLTMRY